MRASQYNFGFIFAKPRVSVIALAVFWLLFGLCRLTLADGDNSSDAQMSDNGAAGSTGSGWDESDDQLEASEDADSADPSGAQADDLANLLNLTDALGSDDFNGFFGSMMQDLQQQKDMYAQGVYSAQDARLGQLQSSMAAVGQGSGSSVQSFDGDSYVSSQDQTIRQGLLQDPGAIAYAPPGDRAALTGFMNGQHSLAGAGMIMATGSNTVSWTVPGAGNQFSLLNQDSSGLLGSNAAALGSSGAPPAPPPSDDTSATWLPSGDQLVAGKDAADTLFDATEFYRDPNDKTVVPIMVDLLTKAGLQNLGTSQENAEKATPIITGITMGYYAATTGAAMSSVTAVSAVAGVGIASYKLTNLVAGFAGYQPGFADSAVAVWVQNHMLAIHDQLYPPATTVTTVNKNYQNWLAGSSGDPLGVLTDGVQSCGPSANGDFGF